MKKTYSDFIKTGQITPVEAIKNQSVRNAAKEGITTMVGEHIRAELPADAFAFGVVDAVAVQFVKWYGPDATADIFRHYAEVCARQKAENGGA